MNEDKVCTLTVGESITLGSPLIVSIDRDYFRKEFEKVFEKWESRLLGGMTPEDQQGLLNDLINAM
jgi:hypothetical protein